MRISDWSSDVCSSDLRPGKELSAGTVQRLTQPQPKSEFALGAAEPLPPGEALVGAVARVAVTPGTRDAEFAILVSRYVAGMGLGRHLMRRLVRWARGKKLERMYGDVLESNQPILSLADSLGFRREASDTPGLVRVVLDLVTADGRRAVSGDGDRLRSPG